MSRKQSRHPKKLTDLPVSVQEGLCVYEAFRRLGFPPSAIHAGLVPTDNPPGGRDFERGPRAGQPVPERCKCVIVMLIAQDQTFTIDYPDPDLTLRQFQRLWVKAARLWNNASDAEAKALWRRSWVLANAGQLVISMIGKGFVFPIDPSISDPEQAMRVLAPTPAEA